MSEKSQQTALWAPAWYELDQSLVIGERQKFWFFQSPPEECQVFGENVDLMFFNQLDSSTNCNVRYAKIVEIIHPELGEMLRVDTDGLDYIFFPSDGQEIVVNAEEEPGVSHDTEIAISDWSVLVKLTEVSCLSPELT